MLRATVACALSILVNTIPLASASLTSQTQVWKNVVVGGMRTFIPWQGVLKRSRLTIYFQPVDLSQYGQFIKKTRRLMRTA